MLNKMRYKTPDGMDDILLVSDGSLTGFAGGLNNKAALLKLEGVLTDHAPDQFQY